MSESDPNLRVPGFPELSWQTDEDRRSSLEALFGYAETHAESAYAWYIRHKWSKRFGSQVIRCTVLLLAGLGGLAPFVVTTFFEDRPELVNLGYLLLGAAAILVAIDKFYGFSNGWMRYIRASQELKRALAEFRFRWAEHEASWGSSAPDPEQTGEALAAIEEFVLEVEDQVIEETRQWIAEFKRNLAAMDRSVEETRRDGKARSRSAT